ncbi:TetR/AcrR family transcriptional regulator [Mesorhizobium sp. USDA-HM6]|nr:TetR/AcrR family transcriptional regulator [Mesorhizobium sp. USDA-HM6]
MAAGSIDRRVARTRRLLQEALVELTAEKGYAPVTVEEICSRADVGRSTFYTHYPDKDCLRKAAIEEHLDAIRRQNPQPNAAGFAFSGLAFAHADATRNMHRALLGGKEREVPAEIRDWIGRQVRRELAEIAGGDGDRLELASRFMTGAFFEVMHWWLEADTGLPPDEVDMLFQKLASDGVKKTLAAPQ